MTLPSVLLQFILAATVVVFAGNALTRCADAVAELTKLGRLLVGSIFLAGDRGDGGRRPRAALQGREAHPFHRARRRARDRHHPRLARLDLPHALTGNSRTQLSNE